ncbi:MAG: Flp pilus assembly complex ATPase component TadA [Gammaproteobacteria bacterium]|nr:Flp pilus assembly complex ATPase component TadA [Gammaproteobacteria bacterium]
MNNYNNFYLNYLLEQKLIDQKNLDEILKNSTNEPIQTIINSKKIKPNILAKSIANFFELTLINLNEIHINDLPLDFIEHKLLNEMFCVPIEKNDTEITIAFADPTQIDTIKTLEFLTELKIKIAIASYDEIKNILTKISNDKSHISNQATQDSEVINLVESVLYSAIMQNASDVHFEPLANSYRIRARIDGVLITLFKPDKNLNNRITARLKIISKLDISEKRLPQDGRFSLKIKQLERDCRINSCPTIHGEKIVVRILSPGNKLVKIEQLGLSKEQLTVFKHHIKQAQGMILVTGPTGSGKTVTLYAALAEINSITKNISTAEDPVEIRLPGINQVNVHPKIDLTFANSLRAFLRQDPDIIMIGEIRDLETADIAVKAAQTGHLVLSTLHTNSAIATINRLINIGIAPHNLADSLKLIIAQRLLRKLCPHCKQAKHYPKELLLKYGFTENQINQTKLYTAHGCDKCLHGFKGRIAIFELLPIDAKTSHLILNKNLLAKYEYRTLREDAITKILAGITSLEEAMRVT